MTEAKYHAGELVQIRDTGEIVTINAVSQGLSQVFYLVFQNNKKNRYKESDLAPYVDKEAALMSQLQAGQFANAESFQRYAYYRLFSESRDVNLYSYQGNRIIFNPFQYKPLMKFLGIDSDERLLIADQVGVGKTIEAGIILDELIARGELSPNDSIVIVCPSILCKKWRAELRSKFQMDDFYIHDGKTLAYMLNDIAETGKVQYPHSIISEQLFRGEKYQDLLKRCLSENGQAFFKMLIVDECHHYRNPGTNTHKFGALLSMCSERVLMLSATPFNLRSDDFYFQLHILNPILFPNQQVFHQLLPQIRASNKAITYIRMDSVESHQELLKCIDELAPLTELNPYIADDFLRLCRKIKQNDSLTIKEKTDFERLCGLLNPIASSFTRTLKRDALEHRVTRESLTLSVHFTEQESDVYRTFLETNLQRYQALGISERAFGLILNGLERIAASSIVALEKNIKRFIAMPVQAFIEQFSDEADIDVQTARSIKAMLEENYTILLGKIQALGHNDSKYNTLKSLIKNIQEINNDNKRVIVFSFYTETLKYLRRRLTGDGYSVALMYGQTPDDTPANQKDEEGYPIIGRTDIMRSFEQGKYDILLVSEVGGQGLDFQFCSSLINYDLPYNPMRIEQRIGRIDRMGQKADKIIVGNLCIEGTIDVIINRVLLSRIADAADLVGQLEPIIAQEMAQINEIIITSGFSEEALSKRQKEMEHRIEKERQTRQEFNEARYEFVNDKGFRDEFEDSIKESRISPRESLRFTYCFLKKENGCWCKPISDTAATIHVTKDICDRLKSYIKRLNLGKNADEIRQLINHNGELLIDFDGNSAYEKPECTFFKPSGVWIRFIVDYIRGTNLIDSSAIFYGNINKEKIEGVEAGRYWLFVYEMDFNGLLKNKTYEYMLVNNNGSSVICLDEKQELSLFGNVSNGKHLMNPELSSFDDIYMTAQDAAEEQKEKITAEVSGKNQVKIQSRIQAIEKLSALRIRQLEDELISMGETNDERQRKAIQREQRKTAERVAILEDKLKCVGTYALDAICLIDVI